MARLTAGLLGLTLLLAGCSGNDEGTGSAAESQSPSVSATVPSVISETAAVATASPSPSSTTATVTPGEAAERYLALVADYNAAFFAAESESQSDAPDLARLRALSQEAADALVAFVREMEATRWPADLQPYADALTKSTRADIAPWQASAKAASLDAWWEVEFPPEDGASARMRTALGLPTTPNP
jgi:hypothetical protein